MKKVTIFIITIVLLIANSESVFAKKKKDIVVESTKELGIEFKNAFKYTPVHKYVDGGEESTVVVYFKVDTENKVNIYHVSSLNAELLKHARKSLAKKEFQAPSSLQNQACSVEILFKHVH
ncbi:MAG: hypothetical protein MI922_28560 [Bacteroidales bacterium]|nr:hypothetical protein [Bacteroidales bacterium]